LLVIADDHQRIGLSDGQTASEKGCSAHRPHNATFGHKLLPGFSCEDLCFFNSCASSWSTQAALPGTRLGHARGYCPAFAWRLPLLAQSRHRSRANQCPLLGAKRTLSKSARMSANDPKRTSANCDRLQTEFRLSSPQD